MDDVIPVVDPNPPGVPAVVILDGGPRLHVRLQAGVWHNGGLLLPVEAVDKVEGGQGANSLAEALGIGPSADALPPEATVWIPGARVRAVVIQGENRRPRPIGFGGV